MATTPGRGPMVIPKRWCARSSASAVTSPAMNSYDSASVLSDSVGRSPPAIPPSSQVAPSAPVIEATVRGLTAKGVAFKTYDGMDQDENGIWATPGGDKVAWFADPDGNTLSLTQFL